MYRETYRAPSSLEPFPTVSVGRPTLDERTVDENGAEAPPAWSPQDKPRQALAPSPSGVLCSIKDPVIPADKRHDSAVQGSVDTRSTGQGVLVAHEHLQGSVLLVPGDVLPEVLGEAAGRGASELVALGADEARGGSPAEPFHLFEARLPLSDGDNHSARPLRRDLRSRPPAPPGPIPPRPTRDAVPDRADDEGRTR